MLAFACFRQHSTARLALPLARTAGMFELRSTLLSAVRHSSTFKTKRMVPVPAATMLQVVAGVSNYHEFVPHCLESTVIKKDAQGAPTLAELRVGWELFDEKFVSNIQRTEDSVVASAQDTAIMRDLFCRWDIKPIDNSRCAVTVELAYSFRNPIYNAVTRNLGPLISRKMIEAFTARAVEMHK